MIDINRWNGYKTSVALNAPRLDSAMADLKKYVQLEHTADIWVRVYGRDLPELFANAGFTFFDQVADLAKVEERECRVVRAQAGDRETLLVAWLGELLYQFETLRTIFKRFDIMELDDSHVAARAHGEKYDPKRHRLRIEIKAVTYHRLAVEKVGDHWEASVIFDI
jgi:SHS2 domain-containing protein